MTGRALRIHFAPAKLNLFLHIVGKRADEYHDIQTLFQLLDWGDDLGLAAEEGTADRISWTGPYAHQVPTEPQRNLIHCALTLLRARCSIRKHVCIRVYKRIPTAAGLGGASSATATLLLALNEHWGLNLSMTQLGEWGESLGADIPFFLRGETALGEGKGERLTRFSVPSYYYLLICPYLQCRTAELFGDSQLMMVAPRPHLAKHAGDFWLREEYTNAFLPVVLKKYPRLQELYTHIDERTNGKEGGRIFLSGTGSTFFTVYKRKGAAAAAYNRLNRSIKPTTAHIQLTQGIHARAELPPP